jgi:hypothetical protein
MSKVKLEELDDAERIQLIGAINPLVWIMSNKIKLGGAPFELKGHEYQQGLFECQDRVQVCIKGAQMGITEVWVLKTLHGLIHGRYPKGSLYLFPTQNDVGDFSKARFDPLIETPNLLNEYTKVSCIYEALELRKLLVAKRNHLLN